MVIIFTFKVAMLTLIGVVLKDLIEKYYWLHI